MSIPEIHFRYCRCICLVSNIVATILFQIFCPVNYAFGFFPLTCPRSTRLVTGLMHDNAFNSNSLPSSRVIFQGPMHRTYQGRSHPKEVLLYSEVVAFTVTSSNLFVSLAIFWTCVSFTQHIQSLDVELLQYCVVQLARSAMT